MFAKHTTILTMVVGYETVLRADSLIHIKYFCLQHYTGGDFFFLIVREVLQWCRESEFELNKLPFLKITLPYSQSGAMSVVTNRTAQVAHAALRPSGDKTKSKIRSTTLFGRWCFHSFRGSFRSDVAAAS